jgi:hypothetical protein
MLGIARRGGRRMRKIKIIKISFSPRAGEVSSFILHFNNECVCVSVVIKIALPFLDLIIAKAIS